MAVSFNQGSQVFDFGPFRLDVKERLFFKNNEPVQLMPKAFDILVVLVRNNGHLVDKGDLLKEVWPDSFVEEGNLTQNIYLLRQALGEETRHQCSVETVRGRGYRFVGNVREVFEIAPVSALIEIPQEKALAEKEIIPETVRLEKSLAAQVASSSRKWLWARTLLGILLIVGSISFSYYLWSKSPADIEQSGIKAQSIAVLPFKALGVEKDHELLGFGMADATIIKLSNLQQIPVIPTSTIFKYTGRDLDPVAVGRELGVEAVLDGTVQHAKDRVRVTVQLIRVADGKTLWSDKFDENFSNIFAVQDSISERMAKALALKITNDNKKLLTKRHTEDTEAYEAYRRGLYFWNTRTQEAVMLAIKYFNEAIAKDPEFALAHALLADSYVLVGYYEYNLYPPDEAYQKGKAAALKALELDESIPEAHVALAMIAQFYEQNTIAAEDSYRRAISLNPDSATVHHRYSQFLHERGRFEESLAEIRLAQQLDPLSIAISNNLGYALYFKREFDQAEKYCQKAHEAEPRAAQPLIILGLIYEQKGKYEDAISTLNKAKNISGLGAVNSDLLEALGHVYAKSGRKLEAQKVLQQLDQLSKQNEDAQLSKAVVHTGLGEINEAFEALEKNAKSWDSPPAALILDPRLDELRSDPRYQELITKDQNNLTIPPTSDL